MKVKELQPRRVVTVERGESLRAAAKYLAGDDIGALAVVGPIGAAGIFSERDLARAVADGVDLDEIQVEEYMTESPVSADQESYVGDAIAKMNEFGVRHLLVTEDGDVTGMISIRDLLGLLGAHWPEF